MLARMVDPMDTPMSDYQIQLETNGLGRHRWRVKGPDPRSDFYGRYDSAWTFRSRSRAIRKATRLQRQLDRKTWSIVFDNDTELNLARRRSTPKKGGPGDDV